MFLVFQFALGYFQAGMVVNQSQSHDLVDFLKWVRLHYSTKDCNVNRKILVLMSCGFKCDCHLFDLCQALPASELLWALRITPKTINTDYWYWLHQWIIPLATELPKYASFVMQLNSPYPTYYHYITWAKMSIFIHFWCMLWKLSGYYVNESHAWLRNLLRHWEGVYLQ